MMASLALGRRQHDLHRARFDDVQGVAGVALVEDHLVPPEAADPQRVDADRQRLFVHAGEERAASKRIDGCRPRGGSHVRSVPLSPRTPGCRAEC